MIKVVRHPDGRKGCSCCGGDSRLHDVQLFFGPGRWFELTLCRSCMEEMQDKIGQALGKDGQD